MSDLPPPPPPPPPGSQPPPPPPPPGAGGGLDSVGPWPRFGARFIDGLVLFIPTIIIAGIVGAGTSPMGSAADGAGILAGVITTLITLGYYVWLESSRGQTVGKMALGYRVVGPDGALPTTEQAFRRNAWVLLPVIPILGSLAQFVVAIVIGVTISSDAFNRGWHDNFAGGTAVVRSR